MGKREPQVITVRAATFRARAIRSYRIFVHRSLAPQDDEWEKVLDLFRDQDVKNIRTLVYTDGGAPNAAQRRRLMAVFGEAKPRIAILTSSAIARAAGTALSWFNPQFRIFGPEDLDGAFHHLGASADDRVVLKKNLMELRAELREVSASPVTL